MKKKININDNVIILTGKYKNIISVVKKISKDKKKILVKNVNLVKKHIKSFFLKKKKINGGILVKEMYIDISNVSLINKKLLNKKK